MAIVTAENLTKHYGAGTNLTKALDGVSLTIAEGEFAAIAGASGSGKSTLLHLLGGLDRPTSGRVQIRGKDLYAMKEEELTVFRRREIGFVFQNYNLVPVLNVLENIVLPAELDGKDPDKTYIAQIVDALGLTEKLSNLADTWVKIPMAGKVESLNAAVAASILMFETARQRRSGRSMK